MKKMRIGVIGTGFIGKQHIEAIRRIPNTEVVAIVDNDPAVAKKVSEELGVEKYFSDYHELLKNPEIDIIHNCTPSSLHYSINLDIIKAKKHVYCEKPLAISSEQSKDLAEMAKKYGVAGGVNLNYRHNAMVQEMRQKVENSTIGRPLMIFGEYLQDWLLYDTDYDWRMNPTMGGPSRAVSDIGSHCFDTAQFILGKKITDVYAHLITVYPVRKRCEMNDRTFSTSGKKVLEEVPIHSEDAAFIMVKFEDGVQGLFHLSQMCAGKKNAFTLTVSGSESSLKWEQETPDKLWIGHRDTPNELLYAGAAFLTGSAAPYATLPAGHPVGWHDALRNAIHAFYASVEDGTYHERKKNFVDFEEGHRLMQLVDACLESNNANEWIHLGLY